jgi:hypothetical protein
MSNSENKKGPRFKQTATLKESLMETPKTSLVSISKIFGWHIKPSLRKEEFASQLAEMILGNPSHVLEFQTVYELRFLKKVVEAPDDEPYKAPLLLYQLSLSDMEILKIRLPEDLSHAYYSIAKDLKEAFKPWIDQVLQRKLDQGEELLDRMTMGFLNLYGIVDKDPLVQMIASCGGVTSDKKAIEDYLLSRSLYCIHQILFNEDDGTQTMAFLSVFLEQEYIDQLMLGLNERPEIRDYKSFSEAEVKAWGQMPFPVHDQPGAEKVYQLLKKGKLPADQADVRMNILWVGTQLENLSLSQQISALLRGLTINVAELNVSLGVVTDFANHIPRWFLRGYCPSEVYNRSGKPQMHPLSDVPLMYPGDNPWAGIKIRPNDPCPCGSGKKYKNCHGKNIN